MTQEEEKRIDGKFKSLKLLLTEMINNLRETINNFTKSNEIKTNNQQAHMSQVHAIANENTMKVIKLEGKVEKFEETNVLRDKIIDMKLNGEVGKIKAAKEAEESTENKGMKRWQFWLGISLSTLFSLSALIITIYKIINP